MNKSVSAILVILLGLLVILIPTYILPVCPPSEIIINHEHHMTYKFMKCHWTAQAEIGVGVVIALIGLCMLLIKSALIRLGLSLSLIIITLLVAALPTVLIGVCPGEMMDCHIGTLPALLLLSAILLIVAIVNAIYLKRHSMA